MSSVNEYKIQRRDYGTVAWVSHGTLPPKSATYTDTSVVLGSVYEYRVSTSFDGHASFGYVAVALERPLVDVRGKLILVVDNTYAAELRSELTRLESDLVGDGWLVLRHDVPRTETVANIKKLIKADYDLDPVNTKGLFLFGHIAVPYSGNTAFDGHDNRHQGAWPADVYYADMNGAWTDTTVDTDQNTSPPVRNENRNVPGDGKFDQSGLAGNADLQLGRVDLSNMFSFNLEEQELLRRYLNKDHAFRHKLITANSRALISNGFGPTPTTAPGTNGWMNFAPMFGAANVATTGDFFTEINQNSYVWVYGSGPGGYAQAAGLGTTAGFASARPQAVFTMMFGSYFGDWDSCCNFLRAPLAADGYGLSCSWSGFTVWTYHPMAIGETLGFCTQITQNNLTTYSTLGYQKRRSIIALMGDPTLRMHIVAPVSHLTATKGTGWDLSWGASPETVIGYHVYRSETAAGPYERLTKGAPIAATTYSDPGVSQKAFTYQVRAVRLETSGSGSYFNASQGVFVNAVP